MSFKILNCLIPLMFLLFQVCDEVLYVIGDKLIWTRRHRRCAAHSRKCFLNYKVSQLIDRFLNQLQFLYILFKLSFQLIVLVLGNLEVCLVLSNLLRNALSCFLRWHSLRLIRLFEHIVIHFFFDKHVFDIVNLLFTWNSAYCQLFVYIFNTIDCSFALVVN